MKAPNLLFVFPDQMRGQATGFLGEEPVITPNLDRFAKEGLVLDNVSCTYPLCSPYRAMFLTGKYPYSNGVISNCTNKTEPYGVELREEDRCWPDILRDSGYSLGYIGKWHLDSPRSPFIDCENNRGKTKWNEWCPPHRRHGFDYWYSYGTYDCHTRPMYWDRDAGREQFHFVDQWGPEHEADKAISYLRNEGGGYRDEERPFALVVSMNPPHTPYDLVPDRYVETYSEMSDEQLLARPNIPPAGTECGDHYREQIRRYYGMITGVDEQFGRILQALDDTGLTENTLVIFTSDHGNCLGIHHIPAKNNHYEESMRVPFIARWPGKILPRRDDLLLSAPDIYPTLLGLLGFEGMIPEVVEGTNYAPHFIGKSQERPESQFCIRAVESDPCGGWRGVRTHRYTFAVLRNEDQGEEVVLYDRLEDPYQLKNIADEEPELVIQYRQELEKWLIKTGDPWLESANDET